MPTTILDGETYEQARHRRFTEEAKVIEKMQQDEIIRMAREAGFAEGVAEIVGLEGFERFYQLAFAAGAAHEREACAKLCETKSDLWYDQSGYLRDCAAAIRARTIS